MYTAATPVAHAEQAPVLTFTYTWGMSTYTTHTLWVTRKNTPVHLSVYAAVHPAAPLFSLLAFP